MATGSAETGAGSSSTPKTCEFCGNSGPSPSWLWNHHRGKKCYETGGHATLESYQRYYRNRERRDRYAANAEEEAAKKREAYAADPEKETARKREAYAADPEKERSRMAGEAELRAARKRDSYTANPEKERSRMAGEAELRAARKRDNYTANPEKESARKRDAYAANPEKERSRMAGEAESRAARKRDNYTADPEKERARKKIDKTRPAEESVGKHLSEVIYGPQFACLCCNTLNFLVDVVPVSEVEGLQSATNRQRFIDLSFVEANACMFEQLDCQHVCLKCVEYINVGDIPPMAAVNRLQCTWSSLPDEFLSLGQHELECVALTRLFYTIRSLRSGIHGHSAAFTKTMLLPMTTLADAAWLRASQEEAQLGWPHHFNSAEVPPVSADVVLNVFRRLLQDHPLYDIGDKTTAVESVKHLLSCTNGRAAEDKGDSVSLGSSASAASGNPQAPPYLDQFAEHCPKVNVLHSVLLPDSKFLPDSTEELIGLKDLAARVGGAVYDLQHKAGMDAERRVNIEATEWVTNRLRHVNRRGPFNQPLLVFSVLLKQELRKLRSTLSVAGSLRRYAGSSKYYQQIAEDLGAIDKCFGSPLFSVTYSLNVNVDVYLATWVSHEEGTAGRPVQVWHTSSEQGKLLLQPGREEPAWGSDTYFVHEREDGASSCPYHPGCKRQPLSVYRQR